MFGFRRPAPKIIQRPTALIGWFLLQYGFTLHLRDFYVNALFVVRKIVNYYSGILESAGPLHESICWFQLSPPRPLGPRLPALIREKYLFYIAMQQCSKIARCILAARISILSSDIASMYVVENIPPTIVFLYAAENIPPTTLNV